MRKMIVLLTLGLFLGTSITATACDGHKAKASVKKASIQKVSKSGDNSCGEKASMAKAECTPAAKAECAPTGAVKASMATGEKKACCKVKSGAKHTENVTAPSSEAQKGS